SARMRLQPSAGGVAGSGAGSASCSPLGPGSSGACTSGITPGATAVISPAPGARDSSALAAPPSPPPPPPPPPTTPPSAAPPHPRVRVGRGRPPRPLLLSPSLRFFGSQAGGRVETTPLTAVPPPPRFAPWSMALHPCPWR